MNLLNISDQKVSFLYYIYMGDGRNVDDLNTCKVHEANKIRGSHGTTN